MTVFWVSLPNTQAGLQPEEHCTHDEDTAWTLREWEATLDDLARDYWLCKDRLDWVAKKFLLETLRDAENLSWSDPWLQSIDLEYHNISLDHGLYYELMREGHMRRFVDEDEIRRAIFQPPETTRAFFRGRAVARFNDAIASIQWDELVFATNGTTRSIEFEHPAHNAALERINSAIRDAESFEDLIARLG